MIWRWLASLLLVVLLLLAGAALWVTGSEPGTSWLAAELEELSGGAVRIRGLEGTLRSGLHVEELALQLDDSSVLGRDLDLRLSVAQLLRGRLVFVELRAGALEVGLQGDPASPPAPFEMPPVSTPIPVEVRELAVDSLMIRVDETETRVAGVMLAAELRGHRLTVRHASARLGDISAELSGAAELVPVLPLQASIAWALAGTHFSGRGEITGELAALHFEGQVRIPDPVEVTATVSDLADQPRVSAQAGWEAISMTVPGLGALQSPVGRMELAGRPSDWTAALEASLQGDALPAVQLRGRVRGDLQQALIDQVLLTGDVGSVTASGSVQLQPGMRLLLEVVATNIRTELLKPELRGLLSARAHVEVRADGAATVRLRDLRGRLMERPLRGQGDFGFSEGELVLRGVNLQAGGNRLRADGVIGKRLSGTFDLDAPQLGVLWPGISGRLDLRATVAGTRTAPELDLQARGDNMELSGNSLQQFSLQARVDRRQQARATLRMAGIRASGQELGDLEAELDGTVKQHSLRARLSGPLLEFTMRSAGRWSGTALEHQLQDAGISNEIAGAWQLRGEPSVSVAAAAASIGAHCWVREAAELCLGQASWSPGRWQAEARLSSLDLQRFHAFLAQGVEVSGTADASLTLDSTDGAVSGSVAWRQRDTTLSYSGGDEPLVTTLEEVELLIGLQPGLDTASLRLGSSSGLRLQGEGSMTGVPGRDAQLQGRISGELPDVGPLLLVLAGDLDLAEIAGRVTVDATLGGTAGNPRLSGEARLSRAAVVFPALGINLQDIDVALLADGSDTFRLSGSVAAGGRLQLGGEFTPLDAGGPAGWINLRGEKLDLVRIPDRYVQASPDITLRYQQGQLRAEGEIRVPRADITIRRLPESAASPSADTVLVDRETPPGTDSLRRLAGGEIAVILGQDVRLQAFGLDTRLEGVVRLSQAADGEPLGYGTVRLKDGTFGAYGKQLVIRRGSVGFAGPLDNPVVNLRADRSVSYEGRNVTAGILVKGTARNPESKVFSEPAMSEADAISYLVAGRPLKSADSDDRSAIAGAAFSLGAQQTSPLTQKIGGAVALDELGVDGGSVDDSQLVAGKQLGDDLYVRFAYGLFSRIGTVMARYRLGQNFSIEAASGEDQSLDLIYSVERD